MSGQKGSTEEFPVKEMKMSNKTAIVELQPFPAGCIITNIRRGNGYRSQWIYAQLRGPNGELLIDATLEYINARLVSSGIELKYSALGSIKIRS